MLTNITDEIIWKQKAAVSIKCRFCSLFVSVYMCILVNVLNYKALRNKILECRSFREAKVKTNVFYCRMSAPRRWVQCKCINNILFRKIYCQPACHSERSRGISHLIIRCFDSANVLLNMTQEGGIDMQTQKNKIISCIELFLKFFISLRCRCAHISEHHQRAHSSVG